MLRTAARSRAAIVALFLLGAGSAAALAAMQWQLIDPGIPLAGRAVHLFHTGAAGGTYLRVEDQFMVPQFWRLEGNTWVRKLETSYPRASYKAMIAYDPVRHVTVRFGGSDKNLVLHAETWEFDGTTWTQRTDVGAPPARIRAGMAYDTERNVMVLFGGYDNNDQALDDTWEYDGVLWRQRVLSVWPPARYDPIMAFDQKRRKMVLAFGRSNTVSRFQDTWEFNGTKWTQPNVPNPPPGRFEAAAAYDPIRQYVYVFGGEGTGETIRWTGNSWDVVATTTHPSARYGASMTFDASRGKVLLYGGVAAEQVVGDTWEWDGATWSLLPNPPAEVDRKAAAAAYVRDAAKGVLAGGCCGTSATGTAEWNGRTWSPVSTVPNPGSLVSAPMASLPPGQALLFGGHDIPLNDVVDRTWAYDGWTSTWTELFPVGRPPARAHASMVYSEAHGGIVLFAGLLTAGVSTNDTWLFTNGNWQQLNTPVRPSFRNDFGMAADSVRGTVVVYGGRYGLSDTWILTGSSWVQSSATGPGVRIGPSMAFDPTRALIVLAGGADELDDTERTWEFDGNSWSSRTTTYSPDMRRETGPMFWDSARGVVVYTSGTAWGISASRSDTWVYGPDDDGDLRVGSYDNCPAAANADQANADGDPAGDVCDCAAADPTAFAVPQPVTGLYASGGAATTLNWSDQSGAVGSGVRYDVASGALSALRAGSVADAACLASQTAVTSASDPRTPATDDGYWYLVRARNVCGIGTYGVAALDAASPCP